MRICMCRSSRTAATAMIWLRTLVDWKRRKGERLASNHWNAFWTLGQPISRWWSVNIDSISLAQYVDLRSHMMMLLDRQIKGQKMLKTTYGSRSSRRWIFGFSFSVAMEHVAGTSRHNTCVESTVWVHSDVLGVVTHTRKDSRSSRPVRR